MCLHDRTLIVDFIYTNNYSLIVSFPRITPISTNIWEVQSDGLFNRRPSLPGVAGSCSVQEESTVIMRSYS